MKNIYRCAIISLGVLNLFGSTTRAAEDFSYSISAKTPAQLKREAEELERPIQQLKEQITALQSQLSDKQFKREALSRQSVASYNPTYWELEKEKLGIDEMIRENPENRRFLRSRQYKHQFTRKRSLIEIYYTDCERAIAVKEFAESLRHLELTVSAHDSEIIIPVYSGGDIHFFFVDVEDAIRFQKDIDHFTSNEIALTQLYGDNLYSVVNHPNGGDPFSFYFAIPRGE